MNFQFVPQAPFLHPNGCPTISADLKIMGFGNQTAPTGATRYSPRFTPENSFCTIDTGIYTAEDLMISMNGRTLTIRGTKRWLGMVQSKTSELQIQIPNYMNEYFMRGFLIGNVLMFKYEYYEGRTIIPIHFLNE